MAVPKKNFNQMEKRVESLNDLTFYTVNYEYELTDMESLTTEQIEVVHREITGTKEFSALTDKSADEKINEWLESLVVQEILKEYEVVDITSQTFYDKLVDSKLSDILELGNIK
jgi:tRNA U38,U39,U40 pseudouridine synthase TruA